MQIDTTSHTSPNSEPRTEPISAIVLHHGAGTRRSDLLTLTSARSRVSAHYYVCRDGTIYQMVPDTRIAWHAGKSALAGVEDVNAFSLGVETEHTTDPDAGPLHLDWPAAQLASLRWLCQTKMREYGIPTSRVVSHRAVALPPGRKSDPAHPPLGPEPAFRAWADALDDTALPIPALDEPYTVHSALLAAITTPVEVVIGRWRYSSAGGYTPYDTESILRAIWHLAASVGLDPVLVAAQMAHETGNLGSWWCMRPRRNPAGLRVTGETSRLPRLSSEWAWNPNTKRWHRGLSFPSWADDAIPAQLGRLLAYVLPAGQGTPEQQALITRALTPAPLPASYRGCAATLQGLEDTWATDNDPNTESFYADRIAALANQLSGRD